MAESLGEVVLGIRVDQQQAIAGLTAFRQKAEQAGQGASQAINRAFAGAGAGQSISGLSIKLNSLQAEFQRVAIGSARFRELRQEIDKTQKVLDRASGSGGTGGIGGFAAGLAGLGVGAGVATFLKGSVQAAVELETITKKLSNTLGDQGAGQALAFTRQLSDQLGLSFKTLSGSFGSFTAAASAANVPLQTQKDLFAAVAKAAQSLGLSNEEIQGSLLALQQIASKGTVSLEELRGQLGERLPIAFAAAANGLGVTQTELIKLVESGQLASSKFFPALTKGLNDLTKSAGGAATSAQNFQKLANAFDALQTSFGESILPTVTDQVKNLINALEGVGVVLSANKLGLGGGVIGNAFGFIPEQGAQAVGALKALQNQFSLTTDQANALFTDAAKEAGGKYDLFGNLIISGKQFEQVLQRLPDLAENFRSKLGGTNRDLLEQKSILGELSALAVKKNSIQSQEVEKIKQANTLVQKASADQINAVNLLSRLQNPKVGATDSQLNDAANLIDRVSKNFRDVIVEGARQAASVLVDAVNRVTEARGALANLRASPDQGLNQFLTPEQRQLRLNNAVGTRGQDLERAISIGSNLLREQGLSFNKSLLDQLRSIVAGATGQTRSFGTINGREVRGAAGPAGSLEGFKKVDDFINAVIRENQSKLDLQAAQKNLVDVNLALKDVNSNLAAQVQALAEKNWQVNVNVPGGTATGDVLGTVSGLL